MGAKKAATVWAEPKKVVKWEELFGAALKVAAAKAEIAVEALKWEYCTTDATWGDRCGLVFFGATPEVNERAAKFFEAWADKNLRKLNVVGGYGRQESIGFEGEFLFTKYANGARGWHRTRELKGWEKEYRDANPPTEAYAGFATSYVYYPCAE